MPANVFRILIADDHELVRRALRSLIESREGWEVCGEAEDGDEAVPKAAALNPDAIILDLAMPRMDGLEAARHILKASPSVPIILHTLYHSAPVDRAAQVVGIHKVTPKTNTVELFVELESLFRDRYKAPGSVTPTEEFIERDHCAGEHKARSLRQTEASYGHERIQ